jgi:4a-hydroxytetrahydrobiopterin dehydratase
MATALSSDAIQTALESLDGWTFADDSISKTYEFKSYVEGLGFATTAGTLCEGMGHHPDIFIGWRKVTLTFTTHDAGSKITQKDIDAATAIEGIGFPK